MSDFSDMEQKIADFFGETSLTIFTDAQVQQATREALLLYSSYNPNFQTEILTIATDGREHDLSDLANCLKIIDVFFPYIDESFLQKYNGAHYITYSNNVFNIIFQGSRIPKAGEMMMINYQEAHSIEGLDGASTTTVPNMDIFVLAVISYCCHYKHIQLSSKYGTKSDEANRFLNFSISEMNSFISFVRSIQNPSIGLNPVAPQFDLGDGNY